MATINQFNDNIRALIRELLGLGENDVRPADQNAPAGPRDAPYASVKIALITSEGQDSSKESADPDDEDLILENIRGTRVLMCSINFFRGDAYYRACRLRALIQSSAAIAKMQEYGLGFIRASDARDLTAAVDSLAEARGQIDIEFYATAGETISVPTYGRFPVEIDNSTITQSFEVFEP